MKPPAHQPETLSDLRLGDVLDLLAVRRWGSLSGAARERQVTPSQISRAVARLERQLQVQILSRSTQGVVFTDSGERIWPVLEDVVARLRHLRRNEPRPTEELTIAGPSCLCSVFLACLADCVPGLRIRGIEMAAAHLRATAPDGLFDVALTLGRESLPAAWHHSRIGALRKGLFANPALAQRLGAQPVAVSRLASVPFINQVHNAQGRLLPLDDGCPLPSSQRVPGHEVQTFSLGLELAISTPQLVYGPVIAARRYIERGFLVEIAVQGWDESETLYVAHHIDRVKARHQRAMQAALCARLREGNAPMRHWAPVSPTADGPRPPARSQPNAAPRPARSKAAQTASKNEAALGRPDPIAGRCVPGSGR